MSHEAQRMNLVTVDNFSCWALVIPVRYYVKHHESYKKKEWCFSLWNT